ncbi:MAG: hypothetical protein OXH00_14015 [Candidatus Poribacteria bacterium]|nr:hypothetical protein [Candidatus Poribacteria bacterium]
MSTKQTHTNEILKHPFPQQRPDVKIVESEDRITEVDCPELQWWFAVPEMDEPHFRVEYDANTLELDAIVEITPTAPATIRGIDCVGLQIREWLAPRDWPDVNPPVMMYATLDDTYSRWISVVNIVDGKQASYTVGDEGFEDAWGGPLKRRIVDDGRYELQADGSYRITDGQGFGAGTYNVTIGENTFHCLRILDVDISEPHGGELAEIYLESGGRTVFFRRYDGRYLRGHDLVAKYPNNRRIVINDIVYVHSDCSGWAHDQLTSVSLPPTS